MKEQIGVNFKATLKLEKYGDNVTDAEIKNKKVKPLETIISEDYLILTDKQFDELFK